MNLRNARKNFHVRQIFNTRRKLSSASSAALIRTPPISDYGKLKATQQRRSRCGREKPFICLCAARKQIDG